jgi:hypothetical protein
LALQRKECGPSNGAALLQQTCKPISDEEKENLSEKDTKGHNEKCDDPSL